MVIPYLERSFVMFCRNCGKEMAPNAVVCVNCGVASGTGNGFCPNCGQAVTQGAVVCLKCGASLQGGIPVGAISGGDGQKSKLVAGLLAIFLGTLGIHNFYLGYTKKGIIQLLVSLVSCGFLSLAIWVWAIVEAIQIFTGSIKVDAKGIPLKD
jgi:TM2 domain-containing membrane protein YozV